MIDPVSIKMEELKLAESKHKRYRQLSLLEVERLAVIERGRTHLWVDGFGWFAADGDRIMGRLPDEMQAPEPPKWEPEKGMTHEEMNRIRSQQETPNEMVERILAGRTVMEYLEDQKR